MPTFALLYRPRLLTLPLQPIEDAPLPPISPYEKDRAVSSVNGLSPVEFSAPKTSSSELLHTLWKVATSKPTSYLSLGNDLLSHLAIFGDLRWRSGLFPSRRWSLSPTFWLLFTLTSRYSEFVWRRQIAPPNVIQCSTPRRMKSASPKAISGRTSYCQVRLAYYSYPQLIPGICNFHGFGPPLPITADSPWPWIAHLVSGLQHPATCGKIRKNALFGLGFPAPPAFSLKLRRNAGTRWLIMQKARSHPVPIFTTQTSPRRVLTILDARMNSVRNS